MIGVVLIALAACAALLYVLAPLRTGRRDDPSDGSPLQEAETQKRAALTAIVDLEDDRDAGKLTQPEFDLLVERYRMEALDALRHVDALTGPDDPDPLEEEIAAMRARLACPECGGVRRTDGSCPECGA